MGSRREAMKHVGRADRTTNKSANCPPLDNRTTLQPTRDSSQNGLGGIGTQQLVVLEVKKTGLGKFLGNYLPVSQVSRQSSL
jgi:hypothetical protein